MSYQLFEDLVVWKKSARLSSDVYKELRNLRILDLKIRLPGLVYRPKQYCRRI